MAGRKEKKVRCGGPGALPGKGNGPRVVLVSQKADGDVYEKSQHSEGA